MKALLLSGDEIRKMVKLSPLITKRMNFNNKKACGYADRNKQHDIRLDDGSGWLICKDCGWRNPRDY